MPRCDAKSSNVDYTTEDWSLSLSWWIVMCYLSLRYVTHCVLLARWPIVSLDTFIRWLPSHLMRLLYLEYCVLHFGPSDKSPITPYLDAGVGFQHTDVYR